MSEEIEEYGDPGIASADAKPPIWLIASYILLPIWGVAWWYFFWNGNVGNGSLNRDYWGELQHAAKTTWHSTSAEEEK